MSTPKLKQNKLYIELRVVGDNGFFKTQIMKKKKRFSKIPGGGK